MPIAIHRAVIRAYTSSTHKADVQLVGSLPTVMPGIPVATDIPSAEVIAGRECTVLLFDEHNPTDAVVVTVHGAVPAAAAAGADPTPVLITPTSRLSIGPDMAASAIGAPASAVWPLANLAIFIPFVLAESVTVRKLFWINGAAVSGNVDCGIYNASGTRLISSGSTPQTPINTVQGFDIADTVMGPGQFYLALALNNILGAFLRFLSSAPANFPEDHWKAMGLAEQTAAFPLPATATLAVYTRNYLPFCGLSLRTLVA